MRLTGGDRVSSAAWTCEWFLDVFPSLLLCILGCTTTLVAFGLSVPRSTFSSCYDPNLSMLGHMVSS